MIDLRLIREQADLVRSSQRARGEDDSVVDALVTADEERRASASRFDALRVEQKAVGKEVAAATGEAKVALLVRAKELSQAVKEAEAESALAAAEAERLLLLL